MHAIRNTQQKRLIATYESRYLLIILEQWSVLVSWSNGRFLFLGAIIGSVFWCNCRLLFLNASIATKSELAKFFYSILLGRVKKHVQHYNKNLKNSSLGVEKFNFSGVSFSLRTL